MAYHQNNYNILSLLMLLFIIMLYYYLLYYYAILLSFIIILISFQTNFVGQLGSSCFGELLLD